MRTVVLDASAALHVVLRRHGFESLVDVLDAASTVAAPRLYCSETANALWKYVRGGHLPEGAAAERLLDCLSLVTHPIADDDLAGEAFTVAVRYGHPAYDAMYAVLARRLSGTVVTRDQRLSTLLDELRIETV